MDVNKQVDYWIKGSKNDLETAELLIKGKKYLEGLFFCHLSVEKALKALVVKKRKELAPKSHNLIYLAELAEVKISDDQNQFIVILMKYQLEGRYPDYYPQIPQIHKVNEFFYSTKELNQCLRQML